MWLQGRYQSWQGAKMWSTWASWEDHKDREAVTPNFTGQFYCVEIHAQHWIDNDTVFASD